MLPNYYAMVPVGLLPSSAALADMGPRQWSSALVLSVRARTRAGATRRGGAQLHRLERNRRERGVAVHPSSARPIHLEAPESYSATLE